MLEDHFGDLPADGQHRVQGVLGFLADNGYLFSPQLPYFLIRHGNDVLPHETDAAADNLPGRFNKFHQRHGRCGFTTARFTDQAQRFLLIDGESDIVHQEAQNALNPVLTIGRQITEMILEHENVTRETALARAKKQLNLVGIHDQRINSYPHEFSGGMKQRAMAAIATACNPKFLILDEPTTGLDVVVQRQILMMLRNLKDELGLTAVFISHDLSVVAETCDRVAVMYAGKIMEESDTISLYQDPLHPYSKALIGAYPSLKGERRKLKSIPGAPPSLIDPPPGCRFAPRCELAQDICGREEPAVNIIDGRRVACHMVK